MGSKKRSPQPTAGVVAGAPTAGEAPGDVGAPPAGKGPAPAPVAAVPKPSDVAPFLTKVYDMVSDPETDSVISWAAGGGSFVIWDSHAFERDLLPRHFKHNHFTSFIRQLNTYGFYKVDQNRWEWANGGFLKDQKHLLKTIKRKKKTSQETPDPPQAPVKTAPGTENIEIGNYGGLEKEVETLKRDKTLLMQQLVDLRHYQQSSSLELQNLIQRLHVMEQNQQQMMALLAIVVQNPDFLNQLVQQQHRTTWWNGDESKKRRFIALEHGPAVEQDTTEAGAPIIQYCPPAPEISNQAIPVNDALCSTPVQPVSSPAVAMPMDAETTSNNADAHCSTGEQFTGASGICDWDDVDMDALFNDLDSMDTSVENDGQTEVPLSVDDYQQLERDCQMEAQQNCRTPQYADVITEA
ncbi:hypothetical protein QOZ80_3BG0288620 [Eleusine coracana subsp. coracana]|nr:hypothetical protein QOZ80_3BG0288620 [Eleusine coracana subsp. coracana]